VAAILLLIKVDSWTRSRVWMNLWYWRKTCSQVYANKCILYGIFCHLCGTFYSIRATTEPISQPHFAPYSYTLWLGLGITLLQLV